MFAAASLSIRINSGSTELTASSISSSDTCRVSSSALSNLRQYSFTALSALSGIIFVSLVEYVWFYPRVMIMFFVVAGVTLATVNILRGE